VIVTPTRVIRVAGAHKPTHGVLWERLEAGMLESIPPLRELKDMQAQGGLIGEGGRPA